MLTTGFLRLLTVEKLLNETTEKIGLKFYLTKIALSPIFEWEINIIRSSKFCLKLASNLIPPDVILYANVVKLKFL
jgi:hypothetical protein